MIDRKVENPRPGKWCDRYRQLPPTDTLTHASTPLLCQGNKGHLYIGVYHSDTNTWTSHRGIMSVEYWQPLPESHPLREGDKVDRKIRKVRFGTWCDARKQTPETDWHDGFSEDVLVQGRAGQMYIMRYNSYYKGWKNYYTDVIVEYWMPLPPKHDPRDRSDDRSKYSKEWGKQRRLGFKRRDYF